MTEIGDILRTFMFCKQILLSNGPSGDICKKVCAPKLTRYDGETPDSILDLVTKIFEETQNCQSEPLDLSKKQPEIPPLPKRLWKPKTFDFDYFFATYIKRFTANDVCNSRCQMLYKDHYHCFAEKGLCSDVMKGKDQLRQHGQRHSIAEELTNVEYKLCVGCKTKDNDCHYHCSQDNCQYISMHLSNMERLKHFEATHCVIISKRTNNNQRKISTHYCSIKRRRKTHQNDNCDVVFNQLQDTHSTNQNSPISSDNQFIDYSLTTIINTIIDNNDLSAETQKIDDNLISSSLLNNQEQEKNYYENGCCSRLFCNLKKGDHYHCPICDRGSSKRELYVRHLKQRHK